MDLKISDLTQEQYDKILNFANSIVGKKYHLSIFRDDCIDWENEIELVFETPEIEDVRILNCLRNYSLCKKYEVKNEEYFDKDELIKDGYEIYYAEATIHSGICIYEHSGSLRDIWDSAIAGIIAIKHKSSDVHFGHKIFKSFLETWQKVNDGDFYGFSIVDNFGDKIDSCGGFWNVDDIKEYLPEYITQEQFENAKENIRY